TGEATTARTAAPDISGAPTAVVAVEPIARATPVRVEQSATVVEPLRTPEIMASGVLLELSETVVGTSSDQMRTAAEAVQPIEVQADQTPVASATIASDAA